MRLLMQYCIKELIIWFSLPIIFISIYVVHYHNPISAASNHLYAISLIASTTILLKTCFYRFIFNKKIALILTAWIYATIFYSLLLYYSLVIIGLNAWGRVISEELIKSYILQIEPLCEAAGISYLMSIAVLLIGYISIVCVFVWLSKKTTIPSSLTLSSKKTMEITLIVRASLISSTLIIFFVLSASLLMDFFLNGNPASKEPFLLTLFSGKANLALSNGSAHAIPANVMLDRQEETARAQYLINPKAEHSNVILIVVDALRFDHMGLYGYARDTTPYLTSLDKLGLLNKTSNVRSSCGETSCALASLLSSRYTHQQPTQAFTLLQVIQHYGYSINMILGGGHKHFYNLRDLYGKVDSFFDGYSAKNYYMNDDTFVIEKTKTLPPWNNKPTMLQFHLMSAHTLGSHLKRFEYYLPQQGYAGKITGESKPEHTNHYDNGVLQADTMIHDLLDVLKAKKYLENTIVIITADHGESLGEHNLISHANSVREELLHIPLISLHFGDAMQLTVNNKPFISQVDIAPTILQYLNMSIPNSWVGQPIQNHAIKNDFTYFQMQPNYGLYDHRQSKHLWKFWVNAYTGEQFAFDISVDPKEQHNLITQIPKTLKNEWLKATFTTIIAH